jgi:hypothetical protein
MQARFGNPEFEVNHEGGEHGAADNDNDDAEQRRETHVPKRGQGRGAH